jgi:hypothetical protein
MRRHDPPKRCGNPERGHNMSYGNYKNRANTQFLPNTTRTLSVPLNNFILDGWLLLRGSITLGALNAAGASGTSGTVAGEGGPINLIKRIKLFANPADKSIYPGGLLVSATPRSLLRWDAAATLGKFFAELAASALGSGAANTYDIYLPIPINFADTNLRQQVATALNANSYAYQSLQFQIETADVAACFTGNDRVVTQSLVLEWIDRRVDLMAPVNPVVLYQTDHLVPIVGANEVMTDGQMPSNGNLLTMLVMAETGLPAATLTDTILNKIRIESPSFSYELKAKDIRYNMIHTAWASPEQAESKAGLFLLDFTEGTLSRWLPTDQLALSYDVLNPGGATLDSLRVFTRVVEQVVTQPAS